MTCQALQLYNSPQKEAAGCGVVGLEQRDHEITVSQLFNRSLPTFSYLDAGRISHMACQGLQLCNPQRPQLSLHSTQSSLQAPPHTREVEIKEPEAKPSSHMAGSDNARFSQTGPRLIGRLSARNHELILKTSSVCNTNRKLLLQGIGLKRCNA